jgi:DNA-binding NtrC family response regulator
MKERFMDILVVEDDIQSGEVIIEFIERWSHRAELTTTGKAALAMIRKRSFDLVVLDIFLPDMMGYDLIPEIKKYAPGIHIITMTGQNNAEMEKKVRARGIIYYMAKPFFSSELKGILDHLSKRKTSQEANA